MARRARQGFALAALDGLAYHRGDSVTGPAVCPGLAGAFAAGHAAFTIRDGAALGQVWALERSGIFHRRFLGSLGRSLGSRRLRVRAVLPGHAGALAILGTLVGGAASAPVGGYDLRCREIA